MWAWITYLISPRLSYHIHKIAIVMILTSEWYWENKAENSQSQPHNKFLTNPNFTIIIPGFYRSINTTGSRFWAIVLKISERSRTLFDKVVSQWIWWWSRATINISLGDHPYCTLYFHLSVMAPYKNPHTWSVTWPSTHGIPFHMYNRFLLTLRICILTWNCNN